jgi:hypothetical protein
MSDHGRDELAAGASAIQLMARVGYLIDLRRGTHDSEWSCPRIQQFHSLAETRKLV